MPYITFIYRIDDKFKKVYYGKYYKNYIYNSEMDNLVDEIKPYLVRCINKYRKLNNLTKIKKNKITIGILSSSIDQNNTLEYLNINAIDKEIKCFDFYYNENKTYINGNLVI